MLNLLNFYYLDCELITHKEEPRDMSKAPKYVR